MVSPAQGPIDLLSPNLPPSDIPRQPASDSLAARLRAIEAPRSWHEPAADEEFKALALENKTLTPQTETSSVSLGSDASADEIEVAFRISEDALSRLEAGLRAQEIKQTSHAVCPPVTELGLSSADHAMQPLNPLSFPSSRPLPANRSQAKAPVARSSRPLLYVLIAAAVIIPIAYHLFPREAPTAVAADKMEPAEAPSLPVVTEPAEAKPDPQYQPNQSYHAVSTPSSQTALGPPTAGPTAPQTESPVAPSSPTVSAGSESGRAHHTRLARHTGGARPKAP